MSVEPAQEDPIAALLKDKEVRLGLRDGLRAARASVQADAESFHVLLYAIERLGSRLNPVGHGLGDYRAALVSFMSRTDAFTSDEVADVEHALFLLAKARNDEQHTGAHARSLAKASISASLVLEAALSTGWPDIQVRDVMTRNPTTAALWHTLGDVRTTLLANAFTALPLWVPPMAPTSPKLTAPAWYLLTDEWLADLLVGKGEAKRSGLLSMTVQAALGAEHLRRLEPVSVTLSNTKLANCRFEQQRPLLLVVEHAEYPEQLLGVVSPADLL